MRTIKSSNDNIYISVIDEPGQGGACHRYEIGRVLAKGAKAVGAYGFVNFQTGPKETTSVNGCQNEDLLAIVVDRLQHFQQGDFVCRENALALTKIQEALHWLEARTRDRLWRGVEGTNKL